MMHHRPLVVQRELVVARVHGHVAALVCPREHAERDGEGGLARAAGSDAALAVDADEPLLGPRRRPARGRGKEHGRVIRRRLAGVVHAGGEGHERLLLHKLVLVVRLGKGGCDVVAAAGGVHGRLLVPRGVEQAMAELVDGLARIPHVGLAGVVAVRAQLHVQLVELIDVLGRVLSRNKSASRSSLTHYNITDGVSTVLAGVSGPHDGVDIVVVLDCGVVDLSSTELQHHDRLPKLAELVDELKLLTRPGEVLAVHCLALDGIVDTAGEHDDIGFARGIQSLGETVVHGGNARAEGVVDIHAAVAERLPQADNVSRVRWVVADELISGVCVGADQGNAAGVVRQR